LCTEPACGGELSGQGRVPGIGGGLRRLSAASGKPESARAATATRVECTATTQQRGGRYEVSFDWRRFCPVRHRRSGSGAGSASRNIPGAVAASGLSEPHPLLALQRADSGGCLSRRFYKPLAIRTDRRSAAGGSARPEPEWKQGRRPRFLIGPGGGEEATKAREAEADLGQLRATAQGAGVRRYSAEIAISGRLRPERGR